jgi:hypothetical protein
MSKYVFHNNSEKTTQFAQYDGTLVEEHYYNKGVEQPKILFNYTRGTSVYHRVVHPFQHGEYQKLRTFIWIDNNVYIYNMPTSVLQSGEIHKGELELIYAGRETKIKDIHQSGNKLNIFVDNVHVGYINDKTAFSINPLTHEINASKLTLEEYNWCQEKIDELIQKEKIKELFGKKEEEQC